MEVAVIMSIYKNDNLKNIQESFYSIISQTFCYFDFYILIDGSITDDVATFINNINDFRVHVFRHTLNSGLAKSMNDLLGVVLSLDFKYIARMDADDVSSVDRLERQVTFLEQHLDIDCVGTWAIEIDYTGDEYFKKKMPLTHVECLNFFRKRDCLIHPTVMFRRSYFEKAGLYPEDTYFGEDTMMWAKGFANGCKFANIPEYLYKFRLDNHFFDRRRGWKHARSIFVLRHKVNKLLGFSLKEDVYAFLYALVKMMPPKVLNLLYKFLR